MAVEHAPCTVVQPPPSPISIRFPGGITIKAMPLSSEVIATELNYVQSLMAQATPLLAAFQPVFILIDLGVALLDTVTSIPGLIVGDVDTFLDALERVQSNVAKLTGLAPQAAVPVLVRDLVAFLVAVLDVLDQQLAAVEAAEAEVAAIQAMAEAAPAAYKDFAFEDRDCAQAQAEAMLAHVIAATGPIQNLLLIIGVISKLVQGLPGMPELGDLTGQSTAEVKAALAELREALELVLSVLPG
jgi:hypothetical protein